MSARHNQNQAYASQVQCPSNSMPPLHVLIDAGILSRRAVLSEFIYAICNPLVLLSPLAHITHQLTDDAHQCNTFIILNSLFSYLI